jgi:membrane protein YqaA with SNARE-associated domain
VKAFVRHLFLFFAHLGGFGLVGLGILDSSFLFMPLGNDLLIVGLTTRHPNRMLYYAVMATIGSVLGCLLVDLVCRRIGEDKLEKLVSRKRLDYVRCKMEKRAAWALAVAALMPPPFPFTPFIMAVSALEYPRLKLLSVIAVSRLVRFLIVGSLAIAFGRGIIRISKTPVFEWTIGLFVVVCIIGSVLSLLKWFRTARATVAPAPAH